MFPDLITQSNPRQRLRCQHSRYSSDDDQQGRDKNSPADIDLEHNADNALWQDIILRAVDYDHIETQARNGIVGLYGHVTSRTNRLQAEQAVRRVAGLQGISNCLVADEQLLSEVATALGSLENCHGCKFLTGVSHGVVLLGGAVEDATTRALAEQSAASNPNVRGVINNIQVRGGALDLPELPFLQPYIGTEVFFLDGTSGRVRQVIIDADNRRVVSMTLRGRFAERGQAPSTSNDFVTRLPERTLVLPMSTVRYITRASGFLNIRVTETRQYSEFHDADFHAPPTDWQAPFPYCSADVLFPTSIQERIAPSLDMTLAGRELKDEMLENDSLGG